MRRELVYFLRHPATAIELATMHALHKTLDTQSAAARCSCVTRNATSSANFRAGI